MIGTGLVGAQVMVFGITSSGSLPGKVLLFVTLVLAVLVLMSFLITRILRLILH